MMGSNKRPISRAIKELENNLSNIGRVSEWANHMGYDNCKKFSRHFLRYYNLRPGKAIDRIKLHNIVKMLREESSLSNFEIAQLNSIPDEKALNNFVNYHLGISPSKIKSFSNSKVEKILENLGSEFRE